MQSLWNDKEAAEFADSSIKMRVYTSRLLGRDPALVMHGGGNTSVKDTVTNLFGEAIEVLFVKGSGWDLATIEAPGFSPVALDVLVKLAQIPDLTDSVIVREQRAALLDPTAPNPSVEAILHAIIPHKFVDHSHADALVTLTNNPNGEKIIREVYGDRVVVVPYVMPGFTLAREVYLRTKDIKWDDIDGIILLNHGLFTFDNDAKVAYENHIDLVTQAENYLKSQGVWNVLREVDMMDALDTVGLAKLRHQVSVVAGKAMLAKPNITPRAHGFSKLGDVGEIATRGPITPDHVIRTKQIPVIINDIAESDRAVDTFVKDYTDYFARNNERYGNLTMLDPAPRWAVWRGIGTISFGETIKAANIIHDISDHTMQTIQWAEALSKWQALPESDIFDMEYWELEQAKLKKGGSQPPFTGKVAIITGAASGIGLACAKALAAQGAAVVGLDINTDITTVLDSPNERGIVCDLTDSIATQTAVRETVAMFGGIDIVVSNAGIFPTSFTLEAMETDVWDKSISINLTSHQRLLQVCIPYLKYGIDPTVIIMGSKNYPAPGRGAGAYSVAKAGVTQLGRVAALELAPYGIRVNTIHPDAVFDTGIWENDILEKRASHYNMTIDEYKTKNLLGKSITAVDVARLVCTVAGNTFAMTTGAQIPIDGGNDRVI